MTSLLERIPAGAITTPFAAALLPQAAAFQRALHDPRRAQESVLRNLRTQVPALKDVGSLDELRSLPIRAWDDIAPLVERAAAGDPRALTSSPLVRFERSGGSSGANKLVPMTRASMAEMNRALQPWLWSLYARTPGVASGAAYWSISPIGQKKQTTAGGFPVGAEDDADYFPAPLRRLLARVLAAPSLLGHFTDVERCRYATLRVLLEREDLTLISVWSPTFLTLLMAALDRHLEPLLDDLASGTCTFAGSVPGDQELANALPLRAMPGRARVLRALAARGRLTGTDVWPRTALLSMWTDAAARAFVDEATSRFPGVPVQGKGLLATEGVVSIPWPHAPAPVLAVRSHVLELLDETGRAHGVHEVEDGKVYEVLLTTGAGLVRYRLGDRVVVEGRAAATPCVRFVGRADAVSDLVGEKLGAAFVGKILDDVRRPETRFAMLAPHRAQGAHYRLYIEDTRSDAEVAALADVMERRLREAHPYRYARDLGQLGPVLAVRVVDGARSWESACVLRGQRAGDIKPTPLSLKDDVDDVFRGRPLPPSG